MLSKSKQIHTKVWRWAFVVNTILDMFPCWMTLQGFASTLKETKHGITRYLPLGLWMGLDLVPAMNKQTPVSSVLLAPTPLCALLCVCGHCGGVGKVQEAPWQTLIATVLAQRWSNSDMKSLNYLMRCAACCFSSPWSSRSEKWQIKEIETEWGHDFHTYQPGRNVYGYIEGMSSYTLSWS